jgi:cytochrome-b5 reductase
LLELEELAKENSHFTFVPTMTQEGENWQGETGYITTEMIKKYIPTLENTVFYLAGPSGFVTALTDLITESGVDSIFIKSEDYGDYT